MTIAVYPGSFDPFTNGHLDILESASKIFDKVIIAVAYNSSKQEFLPVKQRVKLIKKIVIKIKNVEVETFEGLTADYCRLHNADVIVRGLRNSVDFEYELQMSQTNESLNPDLKTVCFMTKPEHSFISSSMVKDVYLSGGDISQYVPDEIVNYLNK